MLPDGRLTNGRYGKRLGGVGQAAGKRQGVDD
jgi:hypothetical protein